MSRLAVVLFNLGGPDRPEAVGPFLRNLFADPAIIPAPGAVRLVLAEALSRARRKASAQTYAAIGGASPLAAETKAQGEALERRLKEDRTDDEVRVFTAMRYWRPLTEEAAEAVAAFAPDDVVLLPLYPQYSTTTTASSFAEWTRTYSGGGRIHRICCYYDDEGLVSAHAEIIRRTWEAAGSPAGMRLLFSAHGLPERTANAGDPYRWQVEQTCARVVAKLGGAWDWRVCYQSRVGPLKWIGPSTVEAIEAAAEAGLGVLIDPIAFVSEHVETLVELDRDYAQVAERVGAAPYLRAPAIGCEPAFIGGLAGLVTKALDREGLEPGGTACVGGFKRCALRQTEGRP